MNNTYPLIKKTSLIIIIFFLLLGCSTNKYQKNYDLGIKYLEEGDYENAIISLNAAIEIEPKEEAYLALADAYTKQEDYENAVAYLSKCNPADQIKDTLFEIAVAYGNKGDYAKVVDIFEQIYEEYGAIDFEKRPNYCAFEELSKDIQQYLEKVFTSVINIDADVSNEIIIDLANGYIDEFEIFTVWNSYKIHIESRKYPEHEESYIIIRMRPDNGVGYDCDFCHGYLYQNMSREFIGFSLDICNCVDYQWNGEYIYNDRSDNYYGDTLHRDSTVGKGNIINNLRDGVFIFNFFSNYCNNGVSSFTRTYNKGVLIDYTDVEPYDDDFIGITGIRDATYSCDTVDDLKATYNSLYW